MNKQSQIDALRYRIERIEAKLAEQHKGANFGATKPSFIPDWKDAPDWARCVAMDKNGTWAWWSGIPYISTHNAWNSMGKFKFLIAGTATNARLLPEDYWKGTLQERPKVQVVPMPTDPDYTHLIPDWLRVLLGRRCGEVGEGGEKNI